MPSCVDTESLIPGRREDKAYLLHCIAAGQLGIVHVAADFNADFSSLLRKHRDVSARRAAAFPRRNEMVLSIDGLDLASCGIEPALVVRTVIGYVENAKKDLNMRIVSDVKLSFRSTTT